MGNFRNRRFITLFPTSSVPFTELVDIIKVDDNGRHILTQESVPYGSRIPVNKCSEYTLELLLQSGIPLEAVNPCVIHSEVSSEHASDLINNFLDSHSETPIEDKTLLSTPPDGSNKSEI